MVLVNKLRDVCSFEDTEIYPEFPLILVQCCAKSRKSILVSGGKERLSKLATNIE